MTTGDYVCVHNGNTLVVERKTIFDFAASIIDGRLFTQIERMQKCPRAAIIICGSKKELLEKSEINYNSVLGAEAWIASLGISVIREESTDDCVYLIIKVFEKFLHVQLMIDFKKQFKCKKRKHSKKFIKKNT